MRRSSVGKTLAGLALSLFALEAVSQSKDEALASIGDNSDEPSGWIRLEVAIFVDTRDETLASELWEVAPELGYPANRRWLTDYAEIKALMDEWGEEAVNIDSKGAISVVPPPPQPDAALNSKTVTHSEEDTEATADATQAIFGDSTTLPLASPDDDSQTLSASLDALNAPYDEATENTTLISDPDHPVDHPESASSFLSQQTLITELTTATEDQEIDAGSSIDNGFLKSPDQLSQPSAPNQSIDNDVVAIENSGKTSQVAQPQSQDPGKIPLESLTAGNSEETNTDSEAKLDAITIDTLKSNAVGLQASVNVASVDEWSNEQSVAENTASEQSLEPSENSESSGTDGGIGTQGPAETKDDTGDFFAIEGLGEDFNRLISGAENSTGLADGSLDSETIDWLSDFATEEPTAGAQLDAEPTPPPLPASYQAMPLEMLPTGLKKLEKETGRRPVALLSWLQPNDEASNAVIVDSWTDEGPTPNLQGTVRVSQAPNETGGYRITTDLWANTTAQYLPERLPAIEIPFAPTRVLLIEPDEAANAEINETRVEFVDIATGLSTVSPSPRHSDLQGISDSLEVSTPPLKHAIRLSETRDLREGYVRYIDHPVIQVAAVWRELTYAELYEMGEAQRVRKDIDSLTRVLVTRQSKKTLNAGQQAPSPSQ